MALGSEPTVPMLALIAVGSVVGIFVLAALILMVRDRLVAPRPLTPTERREAAAAMRATLLAPDWRTVEEQFGQAPPAILRELYADHALLLSAPFTVVGPPGPDESEWDISSFEPADGRREDPWIPPRAFCFARNIFGDPYYIDFADEGGTGPVWVHYHDGGDIVRVADSLAQFLSWPRRVDKRDPDADT